MKPFVVWILVFTCLAANICIAQTVSLSYPINNGVIQRNTLNKATVTIAGQLVHNNLAVTLSYRVRSVSATGVVGVAGPVTNLSLAANGMYYTTLMVNKGWYLCEVLYNGVVYASAKFGVGDVFIVKDNQNEQPGFELNAYPNPYINGFTVAFDVPDNNSHVRLEIIDSQGQVLQTVVNNPHAKGKWEYPVKELPGSASEILFCRLKINENYTVKKLAHVTR